MESITKPVTVSVSVSSVEAVVRAVELDSLLPDNVEDADTVAVVEVRVCRVSDSEVAIKEALASFPVLTEDVTSFEVGTLATLVEIGLRDSLSSIEVVELAIVLEELEVEISELDKDPVVRVGSIELEVVSIAEEVVMAEATGTAEGVDSELTETDSDLLLVGVNVNRLVIGSSVIVPKDVELEDVERVGSEV